MSNPYKVLGVREDATQEEIRAAYLKLVKKYHPDKYADSDLKDVANEKLVEINEAYETLTKKGGQTKSSHASSTGSYQDGYSSAYSGSGGSYSGPYATEFARVRSYISMNDLNSARAVLDNIGVRNAEWYYLYGIIYQRQGWYDKAADYLGRAYQQEPHNQEYANAYNYMRNTGNSYSRSNNTGNSGGSGCSGCDVCSGLLCADCCCECMGSDLIRCC